MDSQDTLDVAKPKYGRRRFLSHGASAVVGLISAFAHSGGVLATSLAKSDRKVRGLVRRLHTVRRLGGNGDGWAMTWASDDSQFISLNDGTGWPGLPEYEQQNSEFHNRVYKISGFPESIQYEYLPGYPNIINMLNVMSRKGMPDNIPMSDPSLFYGYGIVAANGRVYQLLSGLTPSTYTEKDRLSFSGIKLIYSDDNGTTWRNQDGSYPVTFETWPKRSDKCMLFLGGAFSKLTPLQMGKNYALNKDGYMYIYGPLGNSPGDLRNLALCRVPTPKILERAAYEFFVQRKRDGSASWSKKEADARAVHTFPELQIDAIPFPWAWVPSVAYFAALDTYLMASWAWYGQEGSLYEKNKVYLGFWSSPNPWGPWTLVHEEDPWVPENQLGTLPYQPVISPKWISPNGKSFWLVWSEGGIAEHNIEKLGPEDAWNATYKHRFAPLYMLNAQKVDFLF